MKKIKTLALLFLISFMAGGCENYHESIFELWNSGKETIIIKELSVDDNAFVRNVELAPANATETGGKGDNRQNVQIRLSEAQNFELKALIYDPALGAEIAVTEQLQGYAHAGTHFFYYYENGLLSGSSAERHSKYSLKQK